MNCHQLQNYLQMHWSWFKHNIAIKNFDVSLFSRCRNVYGISSFSLLFSTINIFLYDKLVLPDFSLFSMLDYLYFIVILDSLMDDNKTYTMLILNCLLINCNSSIITYSTELKLIDFKPFYLMKEFEEKLGYTTNYQNMILVA